MNEQLISLTKPPAKQIIETKPKANKNLPFVSWSNTVQQLLATVGNFSWKKVPGSELFDNEGKIEASVWELTVDEIDGKGPYSVQSTGDYDGMKNQTQGFRAQVIEANAFRRAASKLGVNLCLYSTKGYENPDAYVIHEYLKSLNGKDLRNDP